jgi:hypothetical protein
MYTKTIHEQCNWGLLGIGGLFGDKIEKFNLSYQVEKEPNITEARRLLVMGVETFLSQINHSSHTQPFLLEIPFPPQRLKFGLSFTNSEEKPIADNSIVFAMLLNGRISYYIDGPIHCEEVHEETYEEALEIVNREREILPNATST